MESRNPVLSGMSERYASQGVPGEVFPGGPAKAAEGWNPAPATQPAGPVTPTPDELRAMVTGSDRVTLDDVVVKTGISFVVLLLGAAFGWTTAQSLPGVWILAALVGFGLAMANIFMKKVSPVLVLAYSLAEGVFLGGISRWYALSYPDSDIVSQAVLGTLVAFGVVLVAYKTGLVKANGRFRKMMAIAMISYLVIAVASLISALFGVGGGWGFYGVGGIGILLCAAGVLLASLSLVLDFEAITQAVAVGAPERESWRLAFGLLVTLIWLYLEILRLLAILQER